MGPPLPSSIIDEALRLCDEILAREDDSVPYVFMGGEATGHLARRQMPDSLLPEGGGLCNILYDKDRLLRRDRLQIQGRPNICR
jgi:hypothetical protein